MLYEARFLAKLARGQQTVWDNITRPSGGLLFLLCFSFANPLWVVVVGVGQREATVYYSYSCTDWKLD